MSQTRTASRKERIGRRGRSQRATRTQARRAEDERRAQFIAGQQARVLAGEIGNEQMRANLLPGLIAGIEAKAVAEVKAEHPGWSETSRDFRRAVARITKDAKAELGVS